MRVTPPVATPADNPLAAGLERRPLAPTALVIFGATGDLARRKLLPAIYNLAHDGGLPERTGIVGVARSDLGEDGFRELVRESIEHHSRRTPDRGVLDALLESVSYLCGSLEAAETFDEIGELCGTLDEEAGRPLDRVFYLATAPELFETIAARLGERGLDRRRGAEVRIVVEKPFGRDFESARRLNAAVLDAFDERQVFRIDHYLGKETVQNMLVLRFANGIFEPVWNRSYVDSVQITAAESIGIGTRAGYYDSAGALRDIAQNHLLQLLTLLCMEPPTGFSADAVREEKVKVLRAIRPMDPGEVAARTVRGQYAAGASGGDEVAGYCQEQGVAPDSETETYVALRLAVDSWRWAGVPFYLRAGKRLARQVTEIAVTMKPVPHLAFPGGAEGVTPNQLVLSVQPGEGISMSLTAKVPGPGMRLRPVNMEFLYGRSFPSQSPEAYERLILDTMRGDATLFARNDEVEAAWRICTPILDAWASGAAPLVSYPAGSAGPAGSDALIEGSSGWRSLL